MLIAAFLAGILNFQKPEITNPSKEKPPTVKETETPMEKDSEVQVVSDDISFDDISLDDDITEEQIVEEEFVEEDISIEPEEEIIDIDDSTASGRLSAMRREIASDSGAKSNSKEDLSKRLDSFFKDR